MFCALVVKEGPRLMLALLTFWIGAVASCAPSAAAVATQATLSAERVISRADFGGTVTVRRGDTLAVPPPIDTPEWQVDFATDVLDLLNPPDKRRSPGPEGWRFRAISVGETDIALTEIPRPSGGAAPAPRRFVVTIRVTN
jgi:hypothetical protein